jgi:hypothetical protein
MEANRVVLSQGKREFTYEFAEKYLHLQYSEVP